MGCGGKTH